MFSSIDDNKFQEEMQQTILPYLKKYRKDFVIQTTGGDLSCSRYLLENPKGQVLISHGFTESKEKYPEVIYYFLQNGYSVWICDHCGHGYSYRLNTDPFLVHIDTFKRYVWDFIALARKARFENPHVPLFVYAHSMGGAIAILAAEKKPELFTALVLSSPMVKPKTGPLSWQQAKGISAAARMVGRGQEYVLTQGPYGQEETFEKSCDTSEPRFAYYKAKRASDPNLQTNAASYDWFQAAAKAEKIMMDQAGQITIPVLLCQAYKDSVVDTTAQMEFLESLDNAPEVYLNIMKNVKHEIFNSKKKELDLYWNSIFQFLQKFTH